MKERSDEEIQNIMDEYDNFKRKLEGFRGEKEERKYELDKLRKILRFIFYETLEGDFSKIGKDYSFNIIMIFREMFQEGRKKGEEPKDIVKDMKIFYERELKKTLPNRVEEIRYENILKLLPNYPLSIFDGEDLSDVFLNFSSITSNKKHKTQRHSIPTELRNKIWNRDGGKCVQCGSNEKIEFDHIIPISKGGSNSYRNLQILCEKCNRSKSDKIG